MLHLSPIEIQGRQGGGDERREFNYPADVVMSRIFFVRGEKVLIDRDLANFMEFQQRH